MFILYKITDNHNSYIPDTKEAIAVSFSKELLESEIEKFIYKKWNVEYEIDEIHLLS